MSVLDGSIILAHKPIKIGADGSPLPNLLVPTTVTLMLSEEWHGDSEEDSIISWLQTPFTQEEAKMVVEAHTAPESESA